MDSKLAYAGGIVRIITTLVGGYLAQRGLATEADVEGIAGAIVLVATGVWSIWAKRKALKAVPPSTKAALALIVCSVFLSGCAVIHGSAGDSAYTGLAWGEKASSTLAGLNITETQSEGGTNILERGVGVDKAGSVGEADMGKILGNLLLLGLQSQGLPVKAATVPIDTDGETDSAIVAETPTASAPQSVISGEGVPVVAIIGNRATCSRCRTLWGKLDTAALSTALCGASIIDADKTSNAAEYARLRPKGAFKYPLVLVYDADGKLAGQFSGAGLTQASLSAKVTALIPSCAATVK